MKRHKKKYFLSTNGVNQILWEVEFSIFLLAQKFSTSVTQKLVQSNLNLNLRLLGNQRELRLVKYLKGRHSVLGKQRLVVERQKGSQSCLVAGRNDVAQRYIFEAFFLANFIIWKLYY
jgi:hypothetical protein